MGFLSLLRLAKVIALALVRRHSIEKRSKLNKGDCCDNHVLTRILQQDIFHLGRNPSVERPFVS